MVEKCWFVKVMALEEITYEGFFDDCPEDYKKSDEFCNKYLQVFRL